MKKIKSQATWSREIFGKISKIMATFGGKKF
jgi:hypothetical protein